MMCRQVDERRCLTELLLAYLLIVGYCCAYVVALQLGFCFRISVWLKWAAQVSEILAIDAGISVAHGSHAHSVNGRWHVSDHVLRPAE